MEPWTLVAAGFSGHQASQLWISLGLCMCKIWKRVVSLKKMCHPTWSTGSGIRRGVSFQWVYQSITYATLCLTCWASTQMMVGPPSSLEINDPGYLGLMDIYWQAPATIHAFSQCTVSYELQYRNIDEKPWRAIQTKQLKYRAAFNLGSGITAKIRTVVKGPCINESEIWSDWLETTYSPSLQGNAESQIEGFQCIYYNWEVLQCTWQPGKDRGHSSNYALQYWQKGLDQTMSCGTYLNSNGTNLGCVLQDQTLEDYTDTFFCVTGIPGLTPVRPSYFILQLQDIVQPAAPEELSISMINTENIFLEWKPPSGKVPAKCLKYEIQHKGSDESWESTAEQRETTWTARKPNSSHILCARVRAKVNTFCADDGLWSDWSPHTCWEEPYTKFPNLLYFGVGGSIIILISVCVTAALLGDATKRCWSQKLHRKEKINRLNEHF
ncbi:interleukin-13 receptor subunit alpha-2 isoform X2 [Ascaphus truei]|uniref:interleukin-13 receptor subunit alpha-2 isoform X2 n=1 Tax=Ascaphus truei TaxID=8439 RepID=UPI003F59673E